MKPTPPTDTIRMILAGMSYMGIASTVTAGLLGIPIMLYLGPPLAMGAAIWTGRTTEPMTPAAPFPWISVLLALVAVGAGLWVEHRTGPGVRWAGRALTWVGAVSVFALPFLYLRHLWGLT